MRIEMRTPPNKHKDRSATPLLARLLAPAGPPLPALVERSGGRVQTVPGRYCVTVLLLGPERCAVVDVGSSADVPGILSALAELGRPVSSIAFVTTSHLHFDHCMGLDALARRTGAPVRLGRVALEAVRGERRLRWPRRLHLLRAVPTWPMQGMPFFPLEDWRRGLDFGFPWAQNRFSSVLGPPLEEGEELPGLPGWRVLEMPGHSDDGIGFHHGAGAILATGDTTRNFIGGEWNPLVCDREAYERTKARLLALDVEVVFPAHGPHLEGPRVLERLRVLPAWCC
jgi:glyoxylase-like metal-dependent hydrolase (beta-lactamase superfamily II)